MTGVAWFNSMLAAAGHNIVMGMVITKNEQGEEKAFLGAGTGENLEEDINAIINWGCKVLDVDAAKALVIAHGGVIKDDLDWADVENNKEASKQMTSDEKYKDASIRS
jgi:F0F1-type ATP synthase epsilon subunit